MQNELKAEQETSSSHEGGKSPLFALGPDREDISPELHNERKIFLIYIAVALGLGLADLIYRDPLYALTLQVVPPWQAQY